MDDRRTLLGKLEKVTGLKGLKLKFAGIILGLFSVWIALGAVFNFIEYRSMTTTEVEGDASIIAGILATSVSQYMLTSQYEGLDAVLATLSNEKDIAYIRVDDAVGGTVKAYGNKAAEDLVISTTQIKSDELTLGTMTVGISVTGHKKRIAKRFILQAVFVAILGTLSVVSLLYSFNRLVLMPLNRMNSILKNMAAGGGDLTQRIDINAKDEMGDIAGNFNSFLGSLMQMVKKAQESSNRVLSLTERIGDRSKTLHSSAMEQVNATNENFKAIEGTDRSVQDIAGSADSLSITATDSSATVTEMAAQVDVVADSTMDLSGHVEEASSSITEMSNSIKEVAENVRALAQLASNTNNSVVQIEESIKDVEAKAKEAATTSREVSTDADTLGNEAIARTIEGMERIKETVDEASDVIERLGKRSAEIGQIVKVIDEVTNQTSLLALNAAILAAQAGEHGKGFDVVANEIKDLAERTSSSTGEISKLIKSVQKESQNAVESMRQGKERVLEGTQMAYGASEALKKILESSNRSMETAMGIEKATTQQVHAVRGVADAIRNINDRVRSIEKATMEQSKGSELIASTADRINDIAKEVRRAMAEQARGIKEFARSLDDTKEAATTIAEATKTQSEGSHHIVDSMERILDIAQSNSDISTEMEAAVEELLRKAENLRDEMGKFNV